MTSEAIDFGSAFQSLKSAQYKVAAELVKNKLIAKGIPESNITIDESLMEDGIKESSFSKEGILYTVLENPDNGENGTVQVGNGSALAVAGAIVIPKEVSNNGYRYTVKEIASSAFHSTENVTSIFIPNTIEKIGVNAISSNLNLTSVVFEAGSRLKELENGAISDNMNLESLIIPASLETVNDYVFGWNYGLKQVTFEAGSKLTKIGKGMFFRGRLLEEITLPSTITEIGEEAFYNCESLVAVRLQGDSSEGAVANLKNIHLIGASAFYGCGKIETLILSEDLTDLESGAFYGCTSLKEIIFGSNIKTFGAILSEDAEEDFKGVFEGCTAIETITLPESVTFIGKNTFFDCISLKKVTINSSELSKLGANAFYGIPSDALFIVKKESAKTALVSSGKIKENQIRVRETLENLIANAQNANANDYTQENYEILQQKINAAKEILENIGESTAEELDTALKELNTALGNKERTKKKRSSKKNNTTVEAPVKEVEVPKTETTEEKTEPEKVSPESFNDIKEHWAYDALVNAIEKGLIKGESKTEFAPNKELSRQEAIGLLYALYGTDGENSASEIHFQDVGEKNDYRDAIAWAYKNNIVSGTGNGNLSPEKAITREEMAAFIYRCNTLKGYDTSSRSEIGKYSDTNRISSYAYENISWAVSKGLLKGKAESTLAPKDKMTKAEAASIAERMESLK